MANREEAYSREALPPQAHPACATGSAWFGGRDRLAGGTWLGVNARGLVVAVTNRRQSQPPESPVSRGLLCRALLANENAQAARALCERQLRTGRFAGCNFLIADREHGAIIEAGEALRASELSPGWHFVTNGPFDDQSDPRIRRVRAELDSSAACDLERWLAASQRICALPANGEAAAVCVVGHDHGTVSSTILALPQTAAHAVYLHADGPPVRTAYHDLSNPFAAFLSGARAAGHRIALRGPWGYELLQRRNVTTEAASAARPLQGVAQMPASWQQLFGDVRGRARFERTFHRPTNLGERERVLIVFERIGGFGPVSVNGRWLGVLSNLEGCQCFDATDVLEPINRLEVELDVSCCDLSAGNEASGLGGTVAIEIRPN